MKRKLNIYDVVLAKLRESLVFRNSDKELIWSIWLDLGRALPAKYEGRVYYCSTITHDDFMSAPSPQSISRARRKVQEKHPELASEKEVQVFKDKKESRGSYNSYHEYINN